MTDQNTLLARVGAGDREAYTQLYTSVRPRMIGYAAALLGGDACAAEDAVNEAFADIWRLVGKFNPVGNANAWIRRIVRNKAVDMLRKPTRREIATDELTLSRVQDNSEGPEQAAAQASDKKWLQASLSVLNLDQREALVLCYFEGLGVEEIAAQTGVAAGTVKSRLFHARNKLRAHLEPQMQEAEAKMRPALSVVHAA